MKCGVWSRWVWNGWVDTDNLVGPWWSVADTDHLIHVLDRSSLSTASLALWFVVQLDYSVIITQRM